MVTTPSLTVPAYLPRRATGRNARRSHIQPCHLEMRMHIAAEYHNYRLMLAYYGASLADREAAGWHIFPLAALDHPEDETVVRPDEHLWA